MLEVDKMNQASQGINSDASASAPLKRKRGRPRKYPMPDESPIFAEHARALRDQNINRGPNMHVPPAYKFVNGNQPRQVDATNSSNNISIGQLVSGVIEAAFDGGYLLAVRVGNSDTTLRGVVFKPGRYVPVSAENDVAPNIQMIKRNEIPLQSENYIQMQVSGPRSRERNGTTSLVASPPGSTVLKGRQVAPGTAQPIRPVTVRGNVVPVVLPPLGTPGNGLPVPNQASAASIQDHMASIGKHMAPVSVQTFSPLNGSAPNKEVPRSMAHVQSETGIDSQYPDGVLHDVETKSTGTPGMPFENLVTEVIKRIHEPSQVEAEQNESSKSGDKSGSTPEDEDSDDDQPLYIEPLQAVQPSINPHLGSMPPHLDSSRTGKMTELLQALQENAMKSEMPGDRSFKNN
ncbi:uncharacterized protein LOC104450237 isoform X1 [Eucalyptus grandis]|uniref:uncharacterized protein LOC104450237 isoform X1 n=1 Tax=Eucalyptus grandis TaxID=71139 RepID=UPI00192E7CE3|nr:uncharacterized protein LOC104450237 isoform X1 [Eucalyptus grandis]XP_010063001.2 uncharacterized protein LOC104450237 isoform X1 [Eucalyptus grandis]